MFNPGDIVRCKYDPSMIAKVTYIRDNEYMSVKYKCKFIRGGFESYSCDALIKNFELLQHFNHRSSAE